MGVVGLISLSVEMVSKVGFGIEMNFDLIFQCEIGMIVYEMMFFELQEWMFLVIECGCEQEIIDIFDKYDLEVVFVGCVIDDKMFCLIYKGEVVCELFVDVLVEEVLVYYKFF